MRPLACVLLLTLQASACAPAAMPQRQRWLPPAALQQHAESLLCRLEPQCQDYRLLWLDSPHPSAEIAFGFELKISRGFYRLLENEAELAFVLLHELAHHQLGHRPLRDPAARLPIELEADAWAAQRLCAAGYPSAPAHRLIERLAQDAAGHAESKLQRLALSEMARRQQALPPCAADEANRPLWQLASANDFANWLAAAREPPPGQ